MRIPRAIKFAATIIGVLGALYLLLWVSLLVWGIWALGCHEGELEGQIWSPTGRKSVSIVQINCGVLSGPSFAILFVQDHSFRRFLGFGRRALMKMRIIASAEKFNLHWKDDSTLFVGCPDCGPCDYWYRTASAIGVKVTYDFGKQSQELLNGRWVSFRNGDSFALPDGCHGVYHRTLIPRLLKLHRTGNRLYVEDEEMVTWKASNPPWDAVKVGKDLYQAVGHKYTVYDFQISSGTLRLIPQDSSETTLEGFIRI